MTGAGLSAGSSVMIRPVFFDFSAFTCGFDGFKSLVLDLFRDFKGNVVCHEFTSFRRGMTLRHHSSADDECAILVTVVGV